MAELPDPTNFGNRPGDGPLRVGGVASDSPLSEEDLPSTMSPSAKKQAAAVAMVRDLWVGNEAVRNGSTRFLPKAPGEDAGNYNSRLERSVFFNAYRRTVEGLTGLVFRRDPVLSDDVPAPIQEHWENIDLEGTHGDVFARNLLQDNLIAGHVAILVEYPKTGGTQRLDQETGSTTLRPYWVPIRKDDIMSWRTTSEDGRRVLTQVVIRETKMVPVGTFGEEKQTVYRVLYRNEGGVGYAVLFVTPQNTVVILEEGDYPTQDEIPLAEVTSSGHESMFCSTPPLLDLAYLNVAHYQQQSDYFWSMHKTCVPFVFGKGIAEDETEPGAPKREFVIGANTAVLQRNPDADMKYVSHDGASLGSIEKALENLKSDMGSLGLAMLSPQKRVAETAEAKRLDKSTSDSALAATARGLQDGLERALGFHAKYLKLPDGGSVEINRDFEGLLMEAEVMTAYAALVNAGFPAHLVLDALQKGGRIAEDEDIETLAMEMEASRLAKEQQREEDREAALAQAQAAA